VSGSIELDLSRTAERLADLVVDKLVERGLVVSLPAAGPAFPVQPPPAVDPAIQERDQ
jgi:hypothetical protein